MTELENLMKKVEEDEKRVLQEREEERLNYCAQLENLFMIVKQNLEDQTEDCMHVMRKQDQFWEQALKKIQNDLIQKLDTQIKKTEIMQKEYESYLRDLTSELEILQRQLKEL